jgi:HSP20-like domain found in ArsA
VRVGPYRRAIMLPDALRRRAVGDARLDGGRLAVTFTNGTDGARIPVGATGGGAP